LSTDPDATKVPVCTILVAEDNDLDADFLLRAFTKTGLPHQLRFVRDGKEAIDYLDGIAPYNDRQLFPVPHLLLLDLKLLRVDGFKVLRWLQVANLKRLPVIVMSDSDLETDKRFAKHLGALEYHVKSSDVDVTAKFLKDACDR
jgi:CheY-like chemotaxis protein